MKFYDQLLAETAADAGVLQSVPLIGRALRGNVTRREYVAFLTQAYHHVKHTVPLMMAAGARLGGEYEWLRVKVAEYIEEEIGHQEWVLDDIAACGADAEAVRHGAPAPETELMVAYAYDTITRGNPVGFFGMVHVLESTSTALASQAAGTLQGALGLPKQAFTYLNTHGALDVGHVDFFRDLVNQLDREADRQALLHGAHMFFRLYADVFRAVERNGSDQNPDLECAA